MAKDPAFLFYPNDYLGGTMGFSFEQHGMYLVMLLFQFNNGPFTVDAANGICGGKFDSIKHKFQINEAGMYCNFRLMEEITKRKKYSESRRDNIKKRYDKHTYVEDMKNICSANSLHMENENENENRNENEVENRKMKILKFIVPSVIEVAEYCIERKNTINAEQFIDHYSARGWMLGKQKMKDWKAAVRTWEKNNFNKPIQKSTYGRQEVTKESIQAILEMELPD